MTSTLRVERPQLLTDLASDRIREAVVAGELKLGEQVSEAQLSIRMGISKTPVREALQRLRMEGLVEIHPQRGTFVFKLTPSEVGQLCRFRAMVEISALRDAVSHNKQQLLDRLEVHVEKMAEVEREGAMLQLARIDMDFHYEFLICCANSYLRSSYELIRYQLIALRTRSVISHQFEHHKALLEGIAGEDLDKASHLLREHILDNEHRYIAACSIA